jgi:hypothetical protein
VYNVFGTQEDIFVTSTSVRLLLKNSHDTMFVINGHCIGNENILKTISRTVKR